MPRSVATLAIFGETYPRFPENREMREEGIEPPMVPMYVFYRHGLHILPTVATLPFVITSQIFTEFSRCMFPVELFSTWLRFDTPIVNGS
jgi:hypothetical protein